MKKKGWVKIQRSITDSDFYFSEPFNRVSAWLDLNLLANHKPGYIRKRGIRVDLKRGDVGMSLEELGSRWKWSKGKVQRYLEDLENERLIKTQKSNVTSYISIVNYECDSETGTQTERRAENEDTGTQILPVTISNTGNYKKNSKNTDTKKGQKNEISDVSKMGTQTDTQNLNVKSSSSAIKNQINGEHVPETGTQTGTQIDTQTGPEQEEVRIKKKERDTPPSPQLFESELTQVEKDFLKFNDWLKKHAPRVLKMEEPINLEQFSRIQKDYSSLLLKNKMFHLLKDMHNWKELLKKNVSAEHTLRNWMDRPDFKKEQQSGGNPDARELIESRSEDILNLKQ